MLDIITIGGATFDVTFFPREGIVIDNKKDVLRQKLLAFEYGAKIGISKSHYSFGGGAANAAVSFSRLGLKTAAIIAVGEDDFGEQIISNFKNQNVNTSLVQKIKGVNSVLSFVIVGPGNDHIIFSDDKVKNRMEITDKDAKNLKNAKWIYLASLGSEWKEILEKVFDAGANARIAWNPGRSQLMAGVPRLKKFLNKTSILVLNLDEAIQLVISDPAFAKKDAAFLNNPKNLFPAIKNLGPKIAVITCGRSGAWAYNGKEFYFTEIKKEQKRVDTTGVGDAFASSFIAGLELFGGDIGRAMKLGIANAASVIAVPGAQNGLLRKKDLAKLNL